MQTKFINFDKILKVIHLLAGSNFRHYIENVIENKSVMWQYIGDGIDFNFVSVFMMYFICIYLGISKFFQVQNHHERLKTVILDDLYQN